MTDPGGNTSDYLGTAVASVGDVNGDGTADVAAAAPYDDEGAFSNNGSVSIFSGANCAFIRKLVDPAGVSSYPLAIGRASDPEALAGICDVNGEGTGDIRTRRPAP